IFSLVNFTLIIRQNKLNLTLQQGELTSPTNGITDNSIPMSDSGSRKTVDKNTLRKFLEQ
ncbi:18665_t:CDS:1, partial [Gigaspora rosea]